MTHAQACMASLSPTTFQGNSSTLLCSGEVECDEDERRFLSFSLTISFVSCLACCCCRRRLPHVFTSISFRRLTSVSSTSRIEKWKLRENPAPLFSGYFLCMSIISNCLYSVDNTRIKRKRAASKCLHSSMSDVRYLSNDETVCRKIAMPNHRKLDGRERVSRHNGWNEWFNLIKYLAHLILETQRLWDVRWKAVLLPFLLSIRLCHSVVPAAIHFSYLYPTEVATGAHI